QQAAARATEVGDHASLGLALNEMGTVQLKLGMLEAAEQNFNRAQKESRRASDLVTEALAYGNLASLAESRNQPSKAEGLLKRALTLAKRADARQQIFLMEAHRSRIKASRR